MTFSNLSVETLSRHLPAVLALPPYDPTAPKAAPVAAPAVRTELERLDDALRMFHEVCPSLRVVDLQGDANARNRAAIISVIEGRRVPQAKAGFNALRAALFAATHTDEEGSLAERTAQFESFASLYLIPPTAEEVAEGVAEIERELAADDSAADFEIEPSPALVALCAESVALTAAPIATATESAAPRPRRASPARDWEVIFEGTVVGDIGATTQKAALKLARRTYGNEVSVRPHQGFTPNPPATDAAPLPAKSEIEPTAAAPAAEVEPAAAPHVAPPCVTVLSDDKGRVLIRYSTPAGYLTAEGQGSPCECIIQVAGGQVDVIMSTSPKAPTYSTEVFPAGDIETLSLFLLSEGGRVPAELYYAPEEGVSLTSPDAPKPKATKAPAEPKAPTKSYVQGGVEYVVPYHPSDDAPKAKDAAEKAPKVAKPSAAEERARVKAERAARTASRAAKKGKTRKGK